jgi:hypothetical protein
MDGGPNRQSLETTLGILGVSRKDAVRVQMARSLADAVDRFPKNAQLWRVYRDVIDALLSDDDRANDALEKALAEIASLAPVRNAKKTGTGNLRRKGGGGNQAARV